MTTEQTSVSNDVHLPNNITNALILKFCYSILIFTILFFGKDHEYRFQFVISERKLKKSALAYSSHNRCDVKTFRFTVGIRTRIIAWRNDFYSYAGVNHFTAIEVTGHAFHENYERITQHHCKVL